MSKLAPRPPQTQIKHEILSEYLNTWSGIITAGLKPTYNKLANQGKPFSAHFVYVDCFASGGVYEESGQRVYGSPIIGIQALDRIRQHTEKVFGYPVSINTILVEKDPKIYEQLLATLAECGYASRIMQAPDLHTLKSGNIATFRGDYKEHIGKILAYTNNSYTWSLYLLDSFGTPGELSTVRYIVTQERTDTIIYFPYNDIQKKLGSIDNDNPNHIHHKHLKYYDEMFGSDDWREVVQEYRTIAETDSQINDSNLSDYVMPKLIERYKQALSEADPNLTIKKIPLRMKTHDRPLYYLYLTTHDPTGALSLNKILDSASIREVLYREKYRLTQVQTQLLWGMDAMLEATTKPKEPEVDAENLATEVYKECRNQQMVYRDVLRLFANSPYYPEDIKKAIIILHKRKLVEYANEKINNRTMLTFK